MKKNNKKIDVVDELIDLRLSVKSNEREIERIDDLLIITMVVGAILAGFILFVLLVQAININDFSERLDVVDSRLDVHYDDILNNFALVSVLDGFVPVCSNETVLVTQMYDLGDNSYMVLSFDSDSWEEISFPNGDLIGTDEDVVCTQYILVKET